jgi:hypothetical protein
MGLRVTVAIAPSKVQKVDRSTECLCRRGLADVQRSSRGRTCRNDTRESVSSSADGRFMSVS